jgi:lysyl endopeptidase
MAMKKNLGVVFPLLLLCFAFPRLAWAQTALENPQPESFQSGIGLISGWVCAASRVDIVFDDGLPFEAAYGTSREDTRQTCGDANNGFGLLFNWNLLGDGTHTVRVLVDGVEFGSATFIVATLGTEFVEGASGIFVLQDFPQAGVNVTIRWEESIQNFVIEMMEPGGLPPPPPPAP